MNDQSSFSLPSVSEKYPEVLFLDGRIYYNSDAGIIRCLADGTEKDVFSLHSGHLITDGKDVYCYNSREILRFSHDGSEETVLKVSPIVNEAYFTTMNTIAEATVFSDTVYYVFKLFENYELWAVGTDGGANHYIDTICHVEKTIEGLKLAEGNSMIVVRYSDLGGEAVEKQIRII